ncbi:TonB-dependent receptor domain-containing protein [Pseudacidovorax sp. RU35E]|uniref:TonB-dependent receptor domain-containing protein n=1 Tax=Pseudacidovorax sp. RU35E TaxID=1907403 RepID=UPI0009556748|nr:TonB-dependent receptor [Pseudacidovorax sp. RU35E]SIR76302.1 iron complex outermembrane recepter protein [Pseudacidovorax sp. RU35E]
MAQQAQTLPEVTVSMPSGTVSPFDVAGSVDRVEGAELRDSRLQVNLSESLGAVPGLQIQNRQNYAQDLQLSVRGFGARSTFGVRGVRLYVDGIPATLPDGQGQTSNIDIGSADRVEIMRGPFSALYGNSSGGVLQVFTETGEGPPTVGYAFAAASAGTLRQSAKASGSTGAVDYLLSTNDFHADGYRDHSEARRRLVNGKLGLQLDGDSRIALSFNSVALRAQDPLGLTAAQVQSDRRGATLAEQYDTRKTVDQTQIGLLYERRLNADNGLRLMVYRGERKTLQFQSIPPSAQANPLQAGGVIDLQRDYAGFDVRWSTRTQLADRPVEVVTGFAYDTLTEQRRGYENYLGNAAAPTQLGVQGRLRRNETNDVSNIDPYVQATWHFERRWTFEAGVRRSTVRFDSQDHYVLGRNGDDSGAARYAKSLPVAALRFAVTRDLNVYTSVGRGFETPTLNELSYRPGGLAGLNLALRPSVNDSVELGAKARLAGGLLTAALFRTQTADEIVTATNVNGRATFTNGGRTRRDGMELGWLHETADHWRTQVAYTWLDAYFRASGQRIPGLAQQSLFASFGYVPLEGWRGGIELRALSSIQAADASGALAPGYALVALYAGYVKRWERWEINAFARIDNLFGRRVIGSVVVNESNGRYYEPAPGRTWTVGAGASYRF